MVSLGGMHMFVMYTYIFELVERDFRYLQFCFLYVNASWYMFGRVCYVFYQCHEASSCFATSLLSKCIVVIQLRRFVCFL